MFTISKGLCPAVALALFAGAAQAETTLTVSSWLPPQHPIMAGMVEPWADKVEAATDGEVSIRILAKPLGSPTAHFDIARDGLADITYGIHGYQPGRFTLTSVAEMPFLGDSAEAISVAYWRTYQKFAADSGEHDGVKVLGIFAHGPGTMMSTDEPIDELSDLEGKKIRTGGGIVNRMSNNLGVVGLLKPASEVYELLSRGVADGVFFPIEAVKAFNLQDTVRHVTTFPGGFYNVSFFFVMNEESWNDLSEAHKAAIDAVSGEAFARMAGQAWDAADEAGRALAEESGITVREASPELVADVSARITPVEEEWFAAAAEKGVDGRAMLAEMRALADELSDP